MKSWNRLFVCLLAGLLLLSLVPNHAAKAEQPIRVVATTFPSYDWVRELIAGQEERFELTLLMDNGVDLHSYQPTAEDLIRVAGCDMFLYVGGESDGWVERALAQGTNPDRVVISLVDALGDAVKNEQIVEGMEHTHDHDHDEHDHEDDHDHDEHDHEEDHDHDEHDHEEDHDHDEHNHEDDHDHDEHDHEDDHDHDEHNYEDDHDHDEHDHEDDHDHDEHDHDHEHEHEVDEHVWLSLRHAATLCRAIADALGTVDSAHADVYAANADAYIAKLNALDAQMQAAVDATDVRTLLFADRFPFRYLVDDYGLSYYAAFSGCSAETEASFETIIFLADKVNELGLTHICMLESGDGKLAQTVAGSVKGSAPDVVRFQSLQSVTAADVAAGCTYVQAMTDNLAALTQALGTPSAK